MSEVSSFSDVDRSADPAECVHRLDGLAVDMAVAKARLTALLGLGPDQRWLDLGCGVGHDLAGHRCAVGLDASVTLLTEARHRLPGSRLVAGDCHALPLTDGSIDACRIERVLQHVVDPPQVLTEARRCLRPGGRIGVFEPDWAALDFPASDTTVSGAIVGSVVERHRHGTIGGRLGALLSDAGFDDVAVEPETVAWRSLDGIRRGFRLDHDLIRAGTSIGSPDRVRRWLAELTELDANGQLDVRFTRYYATGTAP